MATIIPVIHTVDLEQVKYNVKLCVDNGINDVFLIDHRITDDSIKNLQIYYNWINYTYPKMKVGVNYLQLDTMAAKKLAEKVGFDYIWADKSYIEEKPFNELEEIAEAGCHTIYFGCVAFKYQPKVKDLEWSCKVAKDYMDVITTSGSGTGKSPSLEKIQLMRSYIGDTPLAIASGITPENKSMFTDLVDYLLVASSITDKDEKIEEYKLKLLLK